MQVGFEEVGQLGWLEDGNVVSCKMMSCRGERGAGGEVKRVLGRLVGKLEKRVAGFWH
jgi:hypothetical protein